MQAHASDEACWVMVTALTADFSAHRSGRFENLGHFSKRLKSRQFLNVGHSAGYTTT